MFNLVTYEESFKALKLDSDIDICFAAGFYLGLLSTGISYDSKNFDKLVSAYLLEGIASSGKLIMLQTQICIDLEGLLKENLQARQKLDNKEELIPLQLSLKGADDKESLCNLVSFAHGLYEGLGLALNHFKKITLYSEILHLVHEISETDIEQEMDQESFDYIFSSMTAMLGLVYESFKE